MAFEEFVEILRAAHGADELGLEPHLQALGVKSMLTWQLAHLVAS